MGSVASFSSCTFWPIVWFLWISFSYMLNESASLSNLYDFFQLIHTTYSIILRTEVANRIKCSKEEKEIIELKWKVISSSKLSSNYKHLKTSPKCSRDQIF